MLFFVSRVSHAGWKAERCHGNGYFPVPVERKGHLGLFIPSVHSLEAPSSAASVTGFGVTLDSGVVVGRGWFGVGAFPYCSSWHCVDTPPSPEGAVWQVDPISLDVSYLVSCHSEGSLELKCVCFFLPDNKKTTSAFRECWSFVHF